MIEPIKVFVAVAAAGNFSAVAKNSGVAVSSITRRIDWLEEDLGVRLFSRSPRRLILTDAGEKFLESAKHILDEMIEARENLKEMNAEPRGVVTVTAPAMFGRQHVLPAIFTFLQKYPALEVDLHLSDEVIDLSARRADVAIRLGRLPDSDLVATQLAPVHRLVCASPDYLAKHGVPLSPPDLLNHSCLTTVSAPSPGGWWTFQGFNRDQALNVTGRLRSDDTGALAQACIEGLGIVHLASWLVGDMVRDGRLVSVLPDARPPANIITGVHAVHMPGRSHRAKSRLFVSHLREAFGAPPYWDLGISQ
ncbi:LysR family transcriptional regulator [Asticcacaulis sp.]|uniref:LysR family transcriptional regulator n=1 Tax=Asticcacaulis sp. TaxID=1872648 RepID=UPI002B8F0EF4|nr:LysR family transcriptional regulator [Asticcacaulis sp.]HTM82874.1 LysR family transcriptional regulator [Asticcacaulis sp.]